MEEFVGNSIFSKEIINRIFDSDKSTALSICFLSECLKNKKEVTPELLIDYYNRIKIFANEVSNSIDKTFIDNLEKENQKRMKEIIPEKISSNSFSIRKAII